MEYQYGPDGLRRGKKVDGRSRYHVWDGTNMVLEIGVNGVTVARYLRGLELIAREQDGKREYYHQNGHGDIILRTDAWGNALKAYEYDAFGVEQEREKLDTNPFRYCGEYWDEETETIYLRARNYRPAVGSFWSEDTHWNMDNMIYGDDPRKINGRPGDLANPESEEVYTYVPSIEAIRQSSNLYVYCGSNPVTYVDYSGNIFMLLTAAIGAVIGGIGGAIYSYAKYGEVRVENVVAGAAIGGVVGLTGGAAVAYVATGSVTASTSAVLTGLGVAGTAAGGATTAAAAEMVKNVQPDLGNKLNYLFGQATGTVHNIQRSLQMLKQLNSIGILDNPANRAYITEKITESFYYSQAVLQANGREIREIMLMGPHGGVKMQTIWEGAKLITIMLFGQK